MFILVIASLLRNQPKENRKRLYIVVQAFWNIAFFLKCRNAKAGLKRKDANTFIFCRCPLWLLNVDVGYDMARILRTAPRRLERVILGVCLTDHVGTKAIRRRMRLKDWIHSAQRRKWVQVVDLPGKKWALTITSRRQKTNEILEDQERVG